MILYLRPWMTKKVNQWSCAKFLKTATVKLKQIHIDKGITTSYSTNIQQCIYSANVEELLIDFHEFIGSHSGKNLGAAVWSTMELYGLEGQVFHFMSTVTFTYWTLEILAINCYNPSNNDTMMVKSERISNSKGYDFDANKAELHCMHHTVNLIALEASHVECFGYML